MSFGATTLDPYVQVGRSGLVVYRVGLGTMQFGWSVDEAGSFDLVKPLFGGEEPHPAYRPVIAVCNSTEAYVAVGNGIGSEGSAYGAFYSDDELPIETGRMYTKQNAGVANWGDENWGPYFVRHATGLAVANAFAKQAGVVGHQIRQAYFDLVHGEAHHAHRCPMIKQTERSGLSGCTA